MNRPLAVTGLAYMASLALSIFLDVLLSSVLAGLLAAVGLALLWLRPKDHTLREKYNLAVIVCLTVALGCGVMAGYKAVVLSPVEKLSGREGTVSGVIVSEPDVGNYYTRFLLRVEESPWDDAPDTFTIWFTGSDVPECTAYDRFTASVRMSTLADTVSRQMVNVYLARGALGAAEQTGECSALYTEEKPLEASLLSWNSSLSAQITQAIPADASGLTLSVTTGDRSGLDDDILEAFRLTGTRHLLALSGMHLSLLSTILLSFCLAVAIPKKICYTMVSVLIVFYMALVGFPFSILRSGIMLLLALCGQFFRRTSDPLNSLGAAALLVCLFNPFAACDTGFQLSVVTTLGILGFSAPLGRPVLARLPMPGSRRTPRRYAVLLLRSAVQSLTVSLAAVLASFPLLVLTYGSVSLIGPLATLLTAWLLPYIMIPGLLAGLCQPVSWLGWLATASGWIAELATCLMLWIVRCLAGFPLACVYLKRAYVLVWTAGVGFGAGILHLLHVRKRTFRFFLLTACILLLAATLFSRFLRADVLEVSAVDEGSGVLLSTRNSGLYIGALGSYTERSALNSALEAASLNTILLLSPDERTLAAVTAYYPESYVLPVGDGADASTVTLDTGTVYVLNDRCGRAAAVYSDRVTVLVLSDGFDASDLPVEITHPDFLVTLGRVTSLELLNPKSAFVLGMETYQNRLTLLSKGVSLPESTAGENVLRRASARYGDEWLFSSELL